jgi:FAD/FMN-containing dehydrogenase
MVARADPFPGLNGVLGPGGGRWAALNAKVALGDGQRLAAAFDAMIAGMAGEMERLGVRVTRLASAHAAPCFSFEGVFHWHDTWLPLHRSAPDPAHLARLTEPAANPEARALVERLRDMTIDLFRQHGAASNQIGRSYPFLPVLRDEPAALLMAIKQALDPRNLMNPGVLGFPPPAG